MPSSLSCRLCGDEGHWDHSCPNKERVCGPAHRTCMLHWTYITAPNPGIDLPINVPGYYLSENTRYVNDNLNKLVHYLGLNNETRESMRDRIRDRIQLIYRYLAVWAHRRPTYPYTFDCHGETWATLKRFRPLVENIRNNRESETTVINSVRAVVNDATVEVNPWRVQEELDWPDLNTGSVPRRVPLQPRRVPLQPRFAVETQVPRVVPQVPRVVPQIQSWVQPLVVPPQPVVAPVASVAKKHKIRIQTMTEECPICLNRESNVSAQCGHSFCELCVHTMLDRSETMACAICRTEVTGIVCKDASVSKRLTDRM